MPKARGEELITDKVLARHGGRGTFKALLFLVAGLCFPTLMAWVVTPPDVHWAIGPGIFVITGLIVLPFILRSLLTLKSVLTEGGRAVWIEGAQLIFTGESQILPTRLTRGEVKDVQYFEEYGYDNMPAKPTVRITTVDGSVRIIDLFSVVKTVDALSESIEAWRSGS